MPPIKSSTARRALRPTSQTLTIIVGLLVATIAVIHFLQQPAGSPPPPVVPSPVPSPYSSPVVPTPSATPTNSPEPTPTVESEPKPTPTPTLIPLPTRRSQARAPTPGLQSCLPFRWTMTGATPTLNQIFVQIDATNRCGRTLVPEDIWFEISGVRNGSVEHKVRAHPFEEVWPGRTVRISVGLQGSVDWYDEVRVVLLR